MNPRNLTREAIEQLNDIEPYCFETDREEQWFNIGLQYGLDVADSDPKSPWISVDEDLPCNHEELLIGDTLTKCIIIRNPDGSVSFSLMYLNVEWKWMAEDKPTHWFPIPELFK